MSIEIYSINFKKCGLLIKRITGKGYIELLDLH